MYMSIIKLVQFFLTLTEFLKRLWKKGIIFKRKKKDRSKALIKKGI